MPGDLRVYMLGGFRLCVGDEPVDLRRMAERRSKPLLGVLALDRQHAMHRDEVVETLWPIVAPVLEPAGSTTPCTRLASPSNRSLRRAPTLGFSPYEANGSR